MCAELHYVNVLGRQNLPQKSTKIGTISEIELTGKHKEANKTCARCRMRDEMSLRFVQIHL